MRKRILAAMTIVGFSAATMQALVVREFLVAFLGNELCIGVILGAWLALIAAGAWTGARARRRVAGAGVGVLFSLAGLAAAIPLELFLIRDARGLLRTPIGEWAAPGKMFLACFLFQIPVSFLVGALFPLAVRVSENACDDGAPQAGRIYVAEAIGGLMGGVSFSFLFAGRLNAFAIAFGCSLLLLAAVAGDVVISFFRKRNPPAIVRLVGGVMAVVLLACAAFGAWKAAQRAESATQRRRWRTMARGVKLLRAVDSRYTNVAIGEAGGQYFLYVGGQYAMSFPDPFSAQPFANFCLCQRPGARRAALIGVARPGAVEAILRYPIERLDLVELDPVVLDLVQTWSPRMRRLLACPRLAVHHEDGRRFLKRCPRRSFDVVIVQVPDPSTAMLNRFYTVDFLREARRALKPDGVFVATLRSTVNYLGGETGDYARSFYQALTSVFRDVVVTAGATRCFAAAMKSGVVSDSPEELGRRYEKIFPHWKETLEGGASFTPYHFAIFFPSRERIEFIRQELAQPTMLPVNTDARPVTYLLNLRIWAEKSGGVVGRTLSRFLALSAARVGAGVIVLILLMAAVGLLGGREKRERRRLFLAVATTGFVGMSLEVIVVYAFQNALGYVYQQIGLIVGMFMIGLAAGGAAGHRFSGKAKKTSPSVDAASRAKGTLRLAMIGADGVLFATALLVPFACAAARSVPQFAALTIFSAVLAWVGFWTGWQFPVACALYRATGKTETAASGILDGADHFGAFGGAVATGVALVPVLGLRYACWALAGLKLGVLAIWRRR